MLRKVTLGSGLVALVPTVRAATPIDTEPEKPTLVRPSDLPIYEPPNADYGAYPGSHTNKAMIKIRSVIYEPVRTVRSSVQNVVEQTESLKNTAKENINEFQDRSDWLVKYLREEENKNVRYGAVFMGGVTGFIFGLRGGFIKRLLYASAGTTVMGAICFPEETRELAHQNKVLAKQYINIAYNFLYGVKPGDPQLELSFPDLHVPKNFSEFVDLSKSVASSIKQVVLPPSAKETTSQENEKTNVKKD